MDIFVSEIRERYTRLRLLPGSASDWRLKHERPINKWLYYAWIVTRARRDAHSGKVPSLSTREMPSLFKACCNVVFRSLKLATHNYGTSYQDYLFSSKATKSFVRRQAFLGPVREAALCCKVKLLNS